MSTTNLSYPRTAFAVFHLSPQKTFILPSCHPSHQRRGHLCQIPADINNDVPPIAVYWGDNVWLLFILLYLVIPYSFFMECMIVQLHVLLSLQCTLQGICLYYVNSCLRPTDKASTQVKDVNGGLSHKIFLSAIIHQPKQENTLLLLLMKSRCITSYSLQSESSTHFKSTMA